MVVPGAAALALLLLRREGSPGLALRRHGVAVAAAAGLGLAIFALWPLLDPRPDLVWSQFVRGENGGKLDLASFLPGLLGGRYPVWRIWLGPLLNAGLLAPPLLALGLDAWRRRRDLPVEEAELWWWVAGFLIVYSFPTQRQENYVLPAGVALAALLAHRWRSLPSWAIRLPLLLLGLVALALTPALLALPRAPGAPPLHPAWLLAAAPTLGVAALVGAWRPARGGRLLPLLAVLALAAGHRLPGAVRRAVPGRRRRRGDRTAGGRPRPVRAGSGAAPLPAPRGEAGALRLPRRSGPVRAAATVRPPRPGLPRARRAGARRLPDRRRAAAPQVAPLGGGGGEAAGRRDRASCSSGWCCCVLRLPEAVRGCALPEVRALRRARSRQRAEPRGQVPPRPASARQLGAARAGTAPAFPWSMDLRRADLETETLYEISKVLSLSIDLNKGFTSALSLLGLYLGMENGTLSLFNPVTGEVFIEAAPEMNDAERILGRLRPGQGVVGRIFSTGLPVVIEDIGQEPLFLNRTGTWRNLEREPRAFIGVPVTDGRAVLGVLTVTGSTAPARRPSAATSASSPWSRT